MRRKYGVVDVVDESKMRLRFGQIKGAVKGTKLWAGDRVGSELRGAAPSRTSPDRTASLPFLPQSYARRCCGRSALVNRVGLTAYQPLRSTPVNQTSLASIGMSQ